MRKLVFTLSLFLITGAFEQRAAVIIPSEKRDSIQLVIDQLDTLATKTHHLKTASTRIIRNYEN